MSFNSTGADGIMPGERGPAARKRSEARRDAR